MHEIMKYFLFAENHVERQQFSDLQFISDYSNDTSIMRVGKQIRRYLMGTPIGNTHCLHDRN